MVLRVLYQAYYLYEFLRSDLTMATSLTLRFGKPRDRERDSCLSNRLLCDTKSVHRRCSAVAVIMQHGRT